MPAVRSCAKVLSHFVGVHRNLHAGNPCELVFSHVKRAMSVGRAPGEMWAEALGHFVRVTFAEMDRWYKHCIIRPLGH